MKAPKKPNIKKPPYPSQLPEANAARQQSKRERDLADGIKAVTVRTAIEAIPEIKKLAKKRLDEHVKKLAKERD